MYKTIYIPVDNSDHSNTAVDVGISLAKTFGSKIIGTVLNMAIMMVLYERSKDFFNKQLDRINRKKLKLKSKD